MLEGVEILFQLYVVGFEIGEFEKKMQFLFRGAETQKKGLNIFSSDKKNLTIVNRISLRDVKFGAKKGL